MSDELRAGWTICGQCGDPVLRPAHHHPVHVSAAVVERLIAERDRARDVAAILEAQVAKVAEIHAPEICANYAHTGAEVVICGECYQPWPCATACAIGGEDE